MIIRGNTVGTTTPRPDYAQSDPTKPDYIKNKPDDKIENAQAAAKNAQATADNAQTTASSALIAAGNAQTTADGKVAQIVVEVTLVAGNWADNKQTVNVEGVTDENTVIVSPLPVNHIAYAEAGVYCSEQGDGNLTFICDDVPSEDIAVNVLILDGSGSDDSEGSDHAVYGIILVDHTTAKKYNLYIQDGKLTMAESEG